MRWREITEAYYETQKAMTFNDDDVEGDVDIYKNPTRAEVGKLMREHGFVRGFFNRTDLYVWRGDVLHFQVETPGNHWIVIGPNAISVDWNTDAEDYGDLEDNDALVRFVQTHLHIKPFAKGKPVTVRNR